MELFLMSDDYTPRQEWYRQHHLEKYKTLSGRAQHLYNGARTRARQKGLPLGISAAWVLERLEAGVCEATGIELELTSGTGIGRNNPWAPSLDRIDPNRGYTEDNVQVVCWMYNAAKGTHTDEDVMRMAYALVAADV